MLSLYLKSVIVYLIIYWALMKIFKNVAFNRDDVNYKDYAGKGKGMYYIFCFVPILRVIVILVLLYITFAKKESLDKFFKKENK